MRRASLAGLRRACFFGLAALLTACQEGAQQPESRILLDLVQAFPSAVVSRPTGIIDFERAHAGEVQVAGWHVGRRRAGDDRWATWSVGDRSELEFSVFEPRDLEVALRCRASEKTTYEPRRLRLSVNGEEWESIELGTSMKEYRLSLPGHLLQKGLNRLQIENPAARSPRASPQRDVRVLWGSLDFGQETAAGQKPPFAREDKQTLFIPFGVRLDFYLESAVGSWLSSSAVRARGSADGRLLVTWEAEGSDQEILADDLSAIPGFSLPIPGAGNEKGRLALSAISRSPVDPEQPAGIVLHDPRISAPREPPREAPTADARVASPRPPANSPNIIIYMVDTLRADRLGVYGRPGNPSPRVDDFAAEAVVFANAQAQSPWTRASVASVFTGLWPQVHGAQDDEDKLVDSALTLAERLQSLGYQTAGITGNGNAHGPFGFAQGFDHFKYLANLRPGDPLANSEDIHEAVLTWLELRTAEQPFLLYVHTIDPHAPYAPPERHRARWAPNVDDLSIGTVEAIGELSRLSQAEAERRAAELLALYDAEVSYNDESFGRLLDELQRRSLYEESLVIFLSDHGEEFFDHGGWSHGKTLHSEMLDVPLIVKLPGGLGGGKVVAEVAEHVDLLPTIIDLVTGESPPGTQGRSLLSTILSDAPGGGAGDLAVSNVALRGIEATSLIDGDWKLILSSDSGKARFPALYSRSEDSTESKNLAPEMEVLARFLASRLAEIEGATGSSLGKEAISQEELLKVEEELRALGYLQ